MSVFEANAAELERLSANVHETFRRRYEGPHQMAAWKEAAQAFHAAYDALAFPGGLTREFELLARGDVTAIEMAVRFLEANPWYFRSGYNKADLLKLLQKHPLTQEQCTRLQNVILDRVRGRPVREMRAYARLAPKVSTPDFAAELADIAKDKNRQSARHAQLILQYLNVKKRSRPA